MRGSHFSSMCLLVFFMALSELLVGTYCARSRGCLDPSAENYCPDCQVHEPMACDYIHHLQFALDSALVDTLLIRGDTIWRVDFEVFREIPSDNQEPLYRSFFLRPAKVDYYSPELVCAPDILPGAGSTAVITARIPMGASAEGAPIWIRWNLESIGISPLYLTGTTLIYAGKDSCSFILIRRL